MILQLTSKSRWPKEVLRQNGINAPDNRILVGSIIFVADKHFEVLDWDSEHRKQDMIHTFKLKQL